MSIPNLRERYAEHLRELGQRSDLALEAAGYERMIVHSGCTLKQRSVDDQFWPLKLNPTFAHWLPLAEAHQVLLVEKGRAPRLLRVETGDYWEGPPTAESTHFWDYIEATPCSPESVLDALFDRRAAFVGDDLDFARRAGLAPADCNPAALMLELDKTRTTKTAYEVACVEEANRRANLGHERIYRQFLSGSEASELDLNFAYLSETGQDSWETPYKNIVAIGTNAAILHHMHYAKGRNEAKDQSLLVDAGATCLGYVSDITRTVVRGTGAAVDKFQALIDGVDRMQQELCAMLEPGRPYEELHDHSHELVADILIELELCSGSRESLVESGITRAFFPHGLGHSLGLQVHDVGCKTVPPAARNPFLRNTSTVAEHQCLTIEPGIYFVDSLLASLRSSSEGDLVNWKEVDALTPFGGVRVEDDLVITARASRNLTRDNWPS